MITRSQRTSSIVFDIVSPYAKGPEDTKDKQKYKRLCKKSGGLLRTMGLIQFLVFLQAKGQRASEAHHHVLLEHLRQACLLTEGLGSFPSVEAMLEEMRRRPVPAYMRATTEVLSMLQWFKQFADILIEGDDSEHNGDDS